MPHLLLLGAGFSRNWGGWLAAEAFEYLLGCPEVIRDPSLAQLLWRYQPQGGFESALAELQSAYSRDPRSNEPALMGLQAAIKRMFADMNGAFMESAGWEFQNHIPVHGRRGAAEDAGQRPGASIFCMLEDLDALGAKLDELKSRVRALREENQQLRAQLARAQADGEALRSRATAAMQRIDALLDRLPEPERRSERAPSSLTGRPEGEH
jgi:FtsZ-binding cell division protein ZapB